MSVISVSCQKLPHSPRVGPFYHQYNDWIWFDVFLNYILLFFEAKHKLQELLKHHVFSEAAVRHLQPKAPSSYPSFLLSASFLYSAFWSFLLCGGRQKCLSVQHVGKISYERRHLNIALNLQKMNLFQTYAQFFTVDSLSSWSYTGPPSFFLVSRFLFMSLSLSQMEN